MKTIQRMITNICSDNLAKSKAFYTSLFNFKLVYDSDWFVHLVSTEGGLELGIIDRTNAIVPKDTQVHPQGFYISFVVDSADELFKLAQSKNYTIHSEPTDTFYGQRRLLLKDPDGTLVDVSSPIPDFKF